MHPPVYRSKFLPSLALTPAARPLEGGGNQGGESIGVELRKEMNGNNQQR